MSQVDLRWLRHMIISNVLLCPYLNHSLGATDFQNLPTSPCAIRKGQVDNLCILRKLKISRKEVKELKPRRTALKQQLSTSNKLKLSNYSTTSEIDFRTKLLPQQTRSAGCRKPWPEAVQVLKY